MYRADGSRRGSGIPGYSPQISPWPWPHIGCFPDIFSLPIEDEVFFEASNLQCRIEKLRDDSAEDYFLFEEHKCHKGKDRHADHYSYSCIIADDYFLPDAGPVFEHTIILSLAIANSNRPAIPATHYPKAEQCLISSG